MDLKDLKIERKSKPQRRRGSPWPLRLVGLAILGVIAWLGWPALSRFYDRLNLPVVRTLLVTEAAPAAAAAVRGTAANGYVVAARRAALSSDVPGRIVEMNVQEGSIVKEGDVVARLFADDFRAAYERTEANLLAATTAIARAEASAKVAQAEVEEARSALQTAEALRNEGQKQLDFAEQELERMRELSTTGIEGQRALQLASRDRDSAQARLESLVAGVAAAAARVRTTGERAAVAELDIDARRSDEQAARAARDQAKATLDKTDVRAPFDGIVVLKDAEVGEVVSPNAQGGSNARGAVCTMVDFDSLEVQANVPENTLSSVAVGAPAEVFLDAFPDDRYPGTVDRIWPTADRQKATVEVRIKFDRRDDRLRPEMGVRIVFRQDGERAPESGPTADGRRIVVPQEALVQVGGKTGAFVVERDTVRFAAVTAGEAKGGRVAIDAGLSANQRIVLDPPSSLQDGDRIRVEDN
ncbi:MAG: efflux RND transporter periplasmic adaptor subunit [Planctomycetes bacterium]|nr:efflux RND transporter periplasmic adaptor subunit [Planctomycetota bacterium]